MIAIKDPEIRDALSSCTAHFVFASIYSLITTILMFAFPIYVINVYGRVLNSRSLETLLVLFVGFVIAILFRIVFRWLRSALLVRTSIRIDRRLAHRVVECLFERRAAGRADITSQALRDLDGLRNYVAGSGGGAAIDVPWGALFFGALWIVNVPMAITALGTVALVTLLMVVEVLVNRASLEKADRQGVSSYAFVDANLGSAEAVMGMGALRGLISKWQSIREPALSAQVVAAYRGHAFDEAIAAVRLIAFGVFVAVGATEILAGTLNPGILIGAMFIFNFALTPFDKVISAWSGFSSVKEGLGRLERVLEAMPLAQPRMVLPRPAGELTAKDVYFAPPGQSRPILKSISFGIKPGVSLGVVGLIGSGKTTLARLIVGATKPSSGSMRLDGHEVWGWVRADGGRFVGYVPQSVGLITATVAENIGRFGVFDEASILAAAELAGAHEFITKLPLGYDTLVGDGGYPMSGGQRQLVALARAVVGIPPLIVLDEPNSNLDGPGEESLMNCIRSLRESGSTVVLISHRPQLVRQLDKILLLKDGQLVGFGDAEEVLQQLGRPVVVKKAAAIDPSKAQLIGAPLNGTQD